MDELQTVVKLFPYNLRNTSNGQLDFQIYARYDVGVRSLLERRSYLVIPRSTAIGHSPFRRLEEPMSSPRKA